HHLNATAKLVFFLLVSVSAMITYDTRYLIVVAIISILLFKVSHLKWYQVSFVVKFIFFFTVLNLFAVYLFDPEYGVR
ncbi:energy-coupling factor transporter transmembrane protein EcfT, partial [Salmonella enterica subsp. enterica serovar Typhimurium]|uniref:CbiQ family ECF transporter T component n=2 Tax=Bacteria TaxID=2 RepID=UPI0019D66353